MEPKVSIFWVNYNSCSFIDIALESIEAIKNLNYPNFELVVVDNGSTDESFKAITDFIDRIQIKCKIVQLKENLGYTGGNNAAYAAIDRGSKYIALLNNDAVPRQDSLRELVNSMENDETLGAVQGIILNYDEKSIDTAGDYLDELFGTHSLSEGMPPESSKKPVYITSAAGAYSLHRIKAIKKMRGQSNKLFDDFLFACLDDYMLGLKLWNCGFKVKAIPTITAKHKKGSSFNLVAALRAYLGARNMLMLHEISNSRYRNLAKLLFLKHLYVWSLWKILGLKTDRGSAELPELLSKAFVDGVKLGRTRRRLGNAIDVYKAPILEVKYSAALLGITIRKHFIDSSVGKELDKIGKAGS